MRFRCLAAVSIFLASCAAEPASEVQPFGPSASDNSKIVKATFAAKDWATKTLPELSNALVSGELTAQDLTQAYLDRIENVDRAGPQLQAVLSLNPNARQ